MAITKIKYIGEAKKKNKGAHLYNVLRYIFNPEKTQDGRLVGGSNCMPKWKTAYKQMMRTKEQYGKLDQRQAYHMMISFHPDEPVDADLAYKIVQEFVKEYLGDRYECLYSVHDDRDHVHGHIVFNSVSRIDGYKYHYKRGEWRKNMQPITNKICEKYGLSTINLDFEGFQVDEDGTMIDATLVHGRNLNRPDWEARKTHRRSWRDFLRADIDAVLPECSNWEDVATALRKIGWIVRDKKRDGSYLKYYSVKAPFEDCKAIRPEHHLGYGYGREGILERIEKGIFVSPPEEPKNEWDWNKVYRHDRYLEYTNDYQAPPKIKWSRWPKGYKPALTDYQKKRIANLYRTGQMQRYKENEIPMEYRPNIVHLKELVAETNYILSKPIRSEADITKQIQAVKTELAGLDRNRHRLNSIRFGGKSALIFAYEYLKVSGQIKEHIEEYRYFGKTLERHELAVGLLSFLYERDPGKYTSTDIIGCVTNLISPPERYAAEDSLGFLRFIKIDEIDNPEWHKKTIERLEKIVLSKSGRTFKEISEKLLSDQAFMQAPSCAALKQWLADNNIEKENRNQYLAQMEISTEGNAEAEEIRNQIQHLYSQPEKADEKVSEAIDYMSYIRSKCANKKDYENALKKILNDGSYSISSLNRFMKSFNRGEQEIYHKQKKLEEELEMLTHIRQKRYNIPPRRQERTDERRSGQNDKIAQKPM